MKRTQLIDLADKYVYGTANEEERLKLETWYDQQQGQTLAAREQVDHQEHLKIRERILNNINLQIEKRERVIFNKRFYWTAIAGMLFILSFGWYLLVHQTDVKNLNKNSAIIKPGSNKAILTLANGSQIKLDDATTGIVGQQAGISITKTADGQLTYTVLDSKANNAKLTHNIISTPAGGQYQITLPDQTKVWLNAFSSLKYPTSFSGKYRTVELSGEAYFEVAKNKEMPFKVNTRHQEISVLGTHFNVSAYIDDKEVKTTLIEGSVKVRNSGSGASGLLKPGQQAVLTEKDFQILNVDVAEYIAWKNGLFVFNNENIKDAMQKLSRWYDVDIECVGDFEGIEFGGSFPRSNTLQQTLQILESTDKFKFKIEGRRIKILK